MIAVPGISQTTIAKMGKYEPVSLVILGQICKVLDKNIGDILSIEEAKDE